MPPREPARAPRVVALIAAGAALAYLLYPVQRRVEGAGILRPRFEQNAFIRAPVPGAMVTRVDIQYLQRVEAGTPLFAYLVAPHWAVQMAASRTASAAPPPERSAADELRVAPQ